MARGGGTGSRTNKKKKTDVSTKSFKKMVNSEKMDFRDHRMAPQSLLAAGLSRPPRPTEEEMAIR